MQAPRLSKSKFVLGHQCLLRLWWTVHEPDAPELAPSDSLLATFSRGNRAGELAREAVPGGTLIAFEPWEKREAIAATREALAAGAPVVYEASFEEDGVFVAVDILERDGDGWNLVEVKQSGSAKPEHVPDVAVQAHVLRAAGLEIRRVHLMHLNSACRYPDLSDLFVRTDLTAEAAAMEADLPASIEKQRACLSGPAPSAEVGDHCRKPWPCPFAARCHPEPPRHPITQLRGPTKALTARLEELGVESIHDIPDDLALTPRQERQVRAVKEGRTVVSDELAGELAAWPGPFAYLDFESIQTLPPRWTGCGPFTNVPVQWSVHRREADGSLTHHEWLAEGDGDPRPAQVDALLEATAGARSVVVYNKTFESTCLRQLAEVVPSRAEELHDLRERLRDPLPLVRRHVYHPDFEGGFGLKAVGPVLVPELGYDDLEVADGGTASTLLEALLLDPGSLSMEPGALREKLLAYCRLDTLILARLHERLLEL